MLCNFVCLICVQLLLELQTYISYKRFKKIDGVKKFKVNLNLWICVSTCGREIMYVWFDTYSIFLYFCFWLLRVKWLATNIGPVRRVQKSGYNSNMNAQAWWWCWYSHDTHRMMMIIYRTVQDHTHTWLFITCFYFYHKWDNIYFLITEI